LLTGIDSDAAQDCASEWIKSAEFRAIDDGVAEIAFVPADSHKVTRKKSVMLFQRLKSTLHYAVGRKRRRMMNLSISRTLTSALRIASRRKEKTLPFGSGFGTLNVKITPKIPKRTRMCRKT
jgi:hypothetical protein